MHRDPIINFLNCNEIFGRGVKVFAASFWIGVVWTIWKLRNDLIFNEDAPVYSRIVEELKSEMLVLVTYKDPKIGRKIHH